MYRADFNGAKYNEIVFCGTSPRVVFDALHPAHNTVSMGNAMLFKKDGSGYDLYREDLALAKVAEDLGVDSVEV